MREPSSQQCLFSHHDLSACLTFPFGQVFHSKGDNSISGFSINTAKAGLNFNYQNLWQAKLMMIFWSYCILQSKPLFTKAFNYNHYYLFDYNHRFHSKYYMPFSLQWSYFLTCWSLPLSKNLGRAPRAREKPQRIISSVFCSSETYCVTSSSRKITIAEWKVTTTSLSLHVWLTKK